jgi:2'-5' RNA ligase
MITTKNHTSIVIVWPAHFEGSTDTTSHVTALFLGKTGGKFAKAHPNFRERLEAFLEGMTQDPGPIGVEGLIGVGYHKDIPALGLGFQSELATQYTYMYHELKQGGVPIDATYDFLPHVTLTKEKFQAVPEHVHLEAPVLWWGPDRPIHSRHGLTASMANHPAGKALL